MFFPISPFMDCGKPSLPPTHHSGSAHRGANCLGLQEEEEKKKAVGLYLCPILWEEVKGDQYWGESSYGARSAQVVGTACVNYTSLGINAKTKQSTLKGGALGDPRHAV